VMLSIWGDPNQLMRSFKGMTMNSLYEHIATMNSLPVVIDEVSNAKPEAVSDLAYDIATGQPKQRLTREGQSRATKPAWHTIVQTSSNFSMWQKLGAGKVVADAQWVRMLEFRMQRNFIVSPDRARELTNEALECYGTTGDVYMQYVMANLESVKQQLEAVHRRVDEAAGIQTTERFWSAGIAAVVTGLHIAKQLSLIDVDVGAVLKWAVMQIRNARSALKAASTTKSVLFKQIVNDVNGHYIVSELLGGVDTEHRVFARPAQKELWGRLVTADGTMWLTQQCVRDWCANKAADFQSTVAAAKEAGLIEKEELFALGAGTEFPSAAVKCFRLNWLKLMMPDAGLN
jgi:hypothetical protein